MNDVFKFGGRGKPHSEHPNPEAIQAEPGSVLCLVLTIGKVEFITYYCRTAVISRWELQIVNPFRRLQHISRGSDFADYLPSDLHVFCAARLEMIPEQDWMLREYYPPEDF